MAPFVTTKKSLLFPILMLAMLVLCLFPMYWIVITSLKTPVENISRVPTLFPEKLTFENYALLFREGYLKHVWNSVFVTAAATILSLVLAFLASYALVRHRFPVKLNSLFLIWIILAKMLPPVVLAVPLYDMFAKMRLLNNLWGQLMGIGLLATLPIVLFARVVYRQMTSAYSLGLKWGQVSARDRPRRLPGNRTQQHGQRGRRARFRGGYH